MEIFVNELPSRIITTNGQYFGVIYRVIEVKGTYYVASLWEEKKNNTKYSSFILVNGKSLSEMICLPISNKDKKLEERLKNQRNYDIVKKIRLMFPYLKGGEVKNGRILFTEEEILSQLDKFNSHGIS